jgi:hypothetical protein
MGQQEYYANQGITGENDDNAYNQWEEEYIIGKTDLPFDVWYDEKTKYEDD